MKKGVFFYFYYFLAVVIVIANAFFVIKDNFFLDIESVPDGEFQYSEYSPKKSTILKVYTLDTTAGKKSVRVSETNANGTRNIFWQSDAQDVKIVWKNDYVVIINDIDLNLRKEEFFDCRSINSIFNDGEMGR